MAEQAALGKWALGAAPALLLRLQGYNAQAAVSEDQIVVAAELTNAARDSTVFEKMVTATDAKLAAAVPFPTGNRCGRRRLLGLAQRNP